MAAGKITLQDENGYKVSLKPVAGNIDREISLEKTKGRSTVLAGLLSISNKVSIVSDADPFGDGSQVFKWELDGNVNDTDTVTPINGTVTDIEYDYENQKFGTAQAVFNGTTSYITGTSSINSNTFSYSMVVTPDTVDATSKYLIDFTTGRGVLSNGDSITPTENLSYYDGAVWNDLGYKLTVGKQETVRISVNGTTLKLYIDGLLHSTHTVGSTTIDGVFNVGIRYSGVGGYFKGKIDQVEVYNRALTDAEMEALYFQEVTRSDNTVNTTGLEVAYSDGYSNGAVSYVEQVVDGAKTIPLSPSAINYLYKIKDNATIQSTTVEPVWGLGNKRKVVDENPDVFYKGKWYNSTDGGAIGSEIIPDTAYTTPRTYLTDDNGMGIIETDSSSYPSVLHEWIAPSLHEKFISAEYGKFTKGFDLGLGHTNKLSERMLNAEYVNDSDFTIEVSATLFKSSGTGGAYIEVDEEKLDYYYTEGSSATTIRGTVKAKVPPKSTYKVVALSVDTLTYWHEYIKE